MLGLVDGHLLLLFAGLFCVNAAVQQTGMLVALFDAVRAGGIDVRDPAVLFGPTAILSNVVSNVPAVMLLLPAATHDLSGPVLALSSTLAGNLFIVGSIANIIVVDRAAALGVKIDWRTHARIGVPVTLGALALAAGLAVYDWLSRLEPAGSHAGPLGATEPFPDIARYLSGDALVNTARPRRASVEFEPMREHLVILR
jgi:Na+/H+ antiporter NhaD/arsenite permease-like protein